MLSVPADVYKGCLLLEAAYGVLANLPPALSRSAGDLLKKGGNKYQVSGVAARGAGGGRAPSQSMGGGLACGPASSQLSAGTKRSHQQIQPPPSMQPPPPIQPL